MRLIQISGIIISLLFVMSSTVYSHNIYTSFTRIDWNTEDSSLEVVFEVFPHELEEKLSTIIGKQLAFNIDEDYEALAAALPGYLEESLVIINNDTLIPLSYLGFEIQNDLVIMYLEANLPKQPNKLTIINTALLDDVPGQINSITAAIQGQKQSGQIDKGTGPVTFTFK